MALTNLPRVRVEDPPAAVRLDETIHNRFHFETRRLLLWETFEFAKEFAMGVGDRDEPICDRRQPAIEFSYAIRPSR